MLSIYFLLYHQWNTARLAGIFSSGHKEFTHLELGDKQAHAERAYRLMNTEANSEIDRSNTIVDTSTINNSNVIHLFSPLSSVEYRKV
jgi:hypothetical protein